MTLATILVGVDLSEGSDQALARGNRPDRG